jgi:pimeloyl-ACP methyl ester carboxylesterase
MERVRSLEGAAVTYESLGEGSPLVLVHGTLDDYRYWSPVLPAFANHFNVYAINRRGRGGSVAHGDHYTLENDYYDIASGVNTIGRPVALLGHSSGARYALHAAPLIADNIDKLVLYEPPPFDPAPIEVIERLQKLTERNDQEGIVETFCKELVGVSDEEISKLRTSPEWQITVENAYTLLPELRAFSNYSFNKAQFETLHVPTLLLVGSESPLFLKDEI